MQNIYDARVKRLHALASCSLFYGVRAVELEDIASKMDTISVPRGRLIVQHGDETTDVYFLMSGSVIGQLLASSGREVVFTEVAVGGYFGELAALDGGTRSITISASADCMMAKLSERAFKEVLLAYPQVSVNLATDMAKIMRQMNDRVYGLVVHDVETRVRLRLMQLAQEQQQLIKDGIIKNMPTHEAIANFVGSNREAVSRAIAKLKKRGILASDKKRIVIRDIEQLLFLG